MKNIFFKNGAWMLIVMLAFSGCSSTSQARNFNGLPSADGKAISHLSTSNMAIHILGKKPLWGDATLETTVDQFTAEAKAVGASKVRIVQSSQMKWWFLFFPFTLVVTPVTSNVAGEAIQ